MTRHMSNRRMETLSVELLDMTVTRARIRSAAALYKIAKNALRLLSFSGPGRGTVRRGAPSTPPDKQLRKSSETELDWEKIFAELKRPGVKLRLLYEERVESQGLTLSYSQFCRRFNKWAVSKNLSMRQLHVAGECLFIDFSGMTASITNPDTGK